MKDNILKKEFNKKDVTRLRNLIKGNSKERTGQGIGYTKKDEFYARRIVTGKRLFC